jgi:hypothetical protein
MSTCNIAAACNTMDQPMGMHKVLFKYRRDNSEATHLKPHTSPHPKQKQQKQQKQQTTKMMANVAARNGRLH